jgi:hypothetical protein
VMIMSGTDVRLIYDDVLQGDGGVKAGGFASRAQSVAAGHVSAAAAAAGGGKGNPSSGKK